MALGYELSMVQMGGRPAYFAHSSAVIAEGVVIGEGAVIHPNAVLQGKASLGERSTVGVGTHINDAIIGERTEVWNNSSVLPGAELGAGVRVDQSSVINTNVTVGDRTCIQNHVSIPEGVTVGGSVFIGPGAKFPNDRHPRAFGPWEMGETEIGFGASIGANAVVVCGESKPTRVGEFAMLAAGSIATKSLVPFGLYIGNEQVGWVDPLGNTISRDPKKVPSYTRLTDGLGKVLTRRHDVSYAAKILREVDAAYQRIDDSE